MRELTSTRPLRPLRSFAKQSGRQTARNIRPRRMTLQGDAQGKLLFCKLVRENSELVDLRRFGKQVAGPRFFHQGRRHLAVEMRIAPGLVVERVEDGEGGRSLLNGEPRDRARFSVHQWHGRTQKIRDILLFARLSLKWNIQSKLSHRLVLLLRPISHEDLRHILAIKVWTAFMRKLGRMGRPRSNLNFPSNRRPPDKGLERALPSSTKWVDRATRPVADQIALIGRLICCCCRRR